MDGDTEGRAVVCVHLDDEKTSRQRFMTRCTEMNVQLLNEQKQNTALWLNSLHSVPVFIRAERDVE